MSNPFDSDSDSAEDDGDECECEGGDENSDSDSGRSPLGGSGSVTWKTVTSPAAAGRRAPALLKYESSPVVQAPALVAMRALASVRLLLAAAATPQELARQLPCKLELGAADMEVTAGCGSTGADTAVQQLRKDYARDRIIVQGHRLEGSKHSLEELVVLMKSSINASLAHNKRLPLGSGAEADALNTAFCMDVLSSVARTQSAFLTHLKLSEACLQDPARPVAVVPESELADPIKLRFSVKQRHSDVRVGSGDYCVLVEMEAGTVFRFSNALDDELATLLQLRSTFCRSSFGMPAKAGKAGECYLACKSGKAWVLLQKEMTTTRRDWV